MVIYRWTNSTQGMLPNLYHWETQKGFWPNLWDNTKFERFRTKPFYILKLFEVFYKTLDIANPHTGFAWFYGHLYSIVKLHETSEVSCGTFFFSVQFISTSMRQLIPLNRIFYRFPKWCFHFWQQSQNKYASEHVIMFLRSGIFIAAADVSVCIGLKVKRRLISCALRILLYKKSRFHFLCNGFWHL